MKRSPRQLLLSFLGEFLWQEAREQVRARAVIQALEGAGVKPPATRAVLERNVKKGLLNRLKQGREVAYSLTPRSEQVLHDAQLRVQSADPFRAGGDGWSLVLFSLPEQPQPVRHRLRSLLTWEGFAPFGRAAWVAPGEVDFEALHSAMTVMLQTDAVVAFRANVAEGFAMTTAVQRIWDIQEIADAHHRFTTTWDLSLRSQFVDSVSSLSLRTMLVADWLNLLRHDPRLPAEHLPADWPADASHRLFLDWQEWLAEPSREELRAVSGE